LRPLGPLNGEETCEILYHDNKWIVRESEVKLHEQALKDLAVKWSAEIKAATEPKQFKYKLAEKLRISPQTLNKRIAFVAEFGNIA
jgi:hypothetical protein